MAESYMNYKLKIDYHTHTIYSHGKGTIEDNARAAREKGLLGLGITDHGPGHLLYGLNAQKIKNMRMDIDKLKEDVRNPEIYLSIEANIIGTGKCLEFGDVDPGDFDFIIAGYHYGARGGYGFRNFIHKFLKLKPREQSRQMIRNTDMIIKAVYENQIKILTHPGDKGPFDLFEIAKACAEKGTLLEISDRHEYLSVEGIRQTAATDVKYVVNSDAHTPKEVGSCSRGIKRAVLAGLDIDRIVNLEKY